MAGFTKFRSAMGGFHRGDVTNYIEKLCAEHTAAVKKLEQENADLRDRVCKAEAALENAKSLIVEQPLEETPDYPSLELEAYRRAEATERLASERAAALQQRLQDLMDQVSGHCGEAGQQIQTLSQDVRDNLQKLQEVLGELDLFFDGTADRFDALEEDTANAE